MIEHDRQQQGLILDALDRVRNAAIEIDPLARRQFLAALRQTNPHAPLNAVQRNASRDTVRANPGPGTPTKPASFNAPRLDESGRMRLTQPAAQSIPRKSVVQGTGGKDREAPRGRRTLKKNT